jgi:ribosome biogenesis GTPase A
MSNATVELDKNSLNYNYFISGIIFSDLPCYCSVSYNTKHYKLTIFYFRKQDFETKKQHIPLVDRTPLEPPPIIVVVVGPPKVGKTTLIQCLIKTFTKQPLTSLKGPVTLVSG